MWSFLFIASSRGNNKCHGQEKVQENGPHGCAVNEVTRGQAPMPMAGFIVVVF